MSLPPGLPQNCDEHGIRLIADEVRVGLGRTGKFVALEHLDLTPDVLIMAKVPFGQVAQLSRKLRQSPIMGPSVFGQSGPLPEMTIGELLTEKQAIGIWQGHSAGSMVSSVPGIRSLQPHRAQSRQLQGRRCTPA